jgi:hypothetical protein
MLIYEVLKAGIATAAWDSPAHNLTNRWIAQSAAQYRWIVGSAAQYLLRPKTAEGVAAGVGRRRHKK